MEIFNNNSQPNSIGTQEFDASDAYANVKQLFLSVFHLPSQLEINLKAFVETYNETFTSNWNQEMVFGRNDPIATFKDTGREITLAVKSPAFSLQEAQSNLAKCNRLAQFLYPAYQQSNRANTISQPPLVRIRFANLIKRANSGDTPHARDGGLLGFITSLNITPDFEEGAYDPDAATLFPKSISISISFKPLHEHDLGWGPEIGFENSETVNFPFGRTDLSVPFTPDDFVNPQSVEQLQAGPWLPGNAPGEGVLDDDNDGLVDNAQALALRGLGVLDPEREMLDFGVVEVEGAYSVLDPTQDTLPYEN